LSRVQDCGTLQEEQRAIPSADGDAIKQENNFIDGVLIVLTSASSSAGVHFEMLGEMVRA
jgi:hypothetical protein